jgi:hypothetical protein
MTTSGNALSVYLLEDGAAGEVQRVMTAHAATRDRPDKIDCVILDARHLGSLSLDRKNTPGGTPDPGVNRLHRDLADLTASTLVRLAELFFRHGQFVMMLRKQVTRRIADAVRAGAMDEAQLNPRMRESLRAG